MQASGDRKSTCKELKVTETTLCSLDHYLQQMINSGLYGLFCKQYSAMLAARKELNQMIKREPKLAAVCARLPDLL